MKYIADGKSINIPDEFIEKNMENLDISRQEAIELYLTDVGQMVNAEQDEMTAKAKAASTTIKNQSIKPKRKAPERKPDMVKRAMIEHLALAVGEFDGTGDITVTNIERMIAFEYMGEKYEITLTKKRKPKEQR